MQLVSKISNLCDHNPPTLQTDGRHAIPRPRIRSKVHFAVKSVGEGEEGARVLSFSLESYAYDQTPATMLDVNGELRVTVMMITMTPTESGGQQHGNANSEEDVERFALRSGSFIGARRSTDVLGRPAAVYRATTHAVSHRPCLSTPRVTSSSTKQLKNHSRRRNIAMLVVDR